MEEWEEEEVDQQLITYRPWFTIFACVNYYMVIIYLKYAPHPRRHGEYSIVRMFQAEVLIGEDAGTFLWSLEVKWS